MILVNLHFSKVGREGVIEEGGEKERGGEGGEREREKGTIKI